MFENWYKFGARFEAGVEDAFEGHARSVARNPTKYIMGVLFVVILCAAGFMNFKEVTDGDKLWIPQDSEAKSDQKYLEDSFGSGYRGGSMLYVGKSSIGNNVVNLDVFEDMWNAHEEILQVSSKGKTYSDMCAIKDNFDDCFTYGVLQFFSGNRTYYNSIVSSEQDLIDAISATSYPDGTEVNRAQIFGDYEVDSSDRVISVKGTIMFYLVESSPLSTAMTWEERFISLGKGLSTSNVEAYRYTNRSLDDELGSSVAGDIFLMVLTYVFMITITCVVFAKKRNLVETRTGLSFLGVGTVILSIVAAYGLCSGLGVFFVTLHQVLPFIIVGIGVDDMYIIVAAFDAIDEKLPVEERLAQALRRCGMSVSYTTFTNVCAFYLGAMSSLPAIQVFCIYAGTTILFNYLFQLSMFSALLVWDAERINKSNYDILFCCGRSRSPRSVSDSGEVPAEGGGGGGGGVADVEKTADGAGKPAADYAVVLSAGAAAQMDAEEEEDDDDKAAAVISASVEGEQAAAQYHYSAMHATKAPQDMTYLEYFFGEVYYPLLTQTWFRVAIVLCFAGLLAACIYATTRIGQGFDLIDLVPDDSYAREYIQEARKLDVFPIEDNAPLEVVYKDIPYHLQSTQEEMIRLQQEFLEDTEYNRGPWTSWIENFIAWAPSSASPYNSSVNADGYLVDEALFYEAVEDFLALPDYSRFRKDVNMVNATAGDASTLTISTSRVSAFQFNMGDYKDQIRAMERTRDLMDSAQLDPKPFAFAAIYLQAETELIIVDELLSNLGFALVAVACISFIVLIRPGAVLLVVGFIVMIDADLLGTMYYWGLTINTVTVVQLVMAIGLVVDYVSHVLHYYLAQSFTLDPFERLRGCLVEIGPSIMLGCTTTFIGILPLAFASSVIFRTFFRMFFCIIVYGASHGLLLLPAILPSLPFSAMPIAEKVQVKEDAGEYGVVLDKTSGAVVPAEAAEERASEGKEGDNNPQTTAAKMAEENV